MKSSVPSRRLTTWMKATIALLVVYVITLIIEVPIGFYIFIQRQGVAAALGPAAIEAIAVVLMVVFIVYGVRGRRWSYVGATVVGTLHAILSASIYFRPAGPPLALAVFLTFLPTLVALTGAVSVFELRNRVQVERSDR